MTPEEIFERANKRQAEWEARRMTMSERLATELPDAFPDPIVSSEPSARVETQDIVLILTKIQELNAIVLSLLRESEFNGEGSPDGFDIAMMRTLGYPYDA